MPKSVSMTGVTDIMLARGNFVRYITSVRLEEQDEIRKILLDAGALTVEFPESCDDPNQEEPQAPAYEGGLF